MIEALQAAIDAASQDMHRARRGDHRQWASVFCSGHDLKELTAHRADADGGRAFTKLLMQQCAKLMRSIVAVPQAGDRRR